ncbi:MAG TPA: HAMP domain-containing sensor histidine kinase [Acidimicrobiales bacterium]
MRRRLTFAIVGMVVGAVAVVGLGTLALTRLDARHRAEDELGDRAAALADVLAEVRPVRAGVVARRLQASLGVDQVELASLSDPPAWLPPGGAARLRAGETVTVTDGGTVHAAAALPAGGRAVVLTDSIDTGPGAAGRWFVVAGAATALAGVAVAAALARSLARPLVATEATAGRIAAGDLDARVPEPRPGADDELARLAVAINAMAASLQQSRQAERDFLLSVSHDLRTPLTSIRGWSEALADGAAPDPAAAGATIGEAAARLERLVGDLLDLARLRARAFHLDVGPVDLADVAASAAEALRPELEDLGLEVAVDVPPGPVVVDGDPDRLAQVAANLLDNAGRHATRRVRIGVVADGDGPGASAVLAVDDDGPGIPAEDRARVFDRLHTSPRRAARPGTGTGVGLAIVAELVAAMGGRAEAGDAPGGGARLTVSLPRAAIDTARPAGGLPPPSPPAGPPSPATS